MSSKCVKKKPPVGYFRPYNTYQRWYDIWTERIDAGEKPEEVLDGLCENACSTKIGASDECQSYTRHIHACLKAAYLVGRATEEKGGE